jgi:hypothetical protein
MLMMVAHIDVQQDGTWNSNFTYVFVGCLPAGEDWFSGSDPEIPAPSGGRFGPEAL